jgi:hypothetical protein
VLNAPLTVVEVTIVGTEAATGVPVPEPDAAPTPAEFTALINTVYSVPLLSPDIISGLVVHPTEI